MAVQVDAPGGGVGDAQRAGAQQSVARHLRPDAARHFQQQLRLVKIIAQVKPHDCLADVGAVGYGDAFPVAIGPLPALRGEHFVPQRVVGDAGRHRIALRNGNDHAEMRYPLGKIAGAVDGVNHPSIRRRPRHRRRFLGQDAEIGVFRRYIVQYQPFRRQISVGYHIGAPFQADLDFGTKAFHYQGAGAPGRRFADGQGGMAALGTGQIIVGERQGHRSSVSRSSIVRPRMNGRPAPAV